MNNKPIGPALHGANDYGLVVAQLLAPTLLGFTGRTRALCYGSAALTATINGLTKAPLGLVKLIPFKVHGQLEIPILPTLILLPWAVGALKPPRSRSYFLAFFVVALTNFLLTDYNAYELEEKAEG